MINVVTNNNASSTIITIKQEAMSTGGASSVDSLVGSFVDSTTFLHSPNSQMVNPILVQSNNGGVLGASGGGGNGGGAGENFI